MKTIFAVLCLMSISLPTFASATSKINYSIFSGVFVLNAHNPPGDCEANYPQPLQLDNSPQDQTIGDVSRDNETLIFNHINQGRVAFNSCWSDGMLGYTETTGQGSIVEQKIVIYKPGFFCQGGRLKSELRTTLEIKDNQLILTSSSSDSSPARICQFKRVQ